MDARQELMNRRALRDAIAAGDLRAELQARRALRGIAKPTADGGNALTEAAAVGTRIATNLGRLATNVVDVAGVAGQRAVHNLMESDDDAALRAATGPAAQEQQAAQVLRESGQSQLPSERTLPTDTRPQPFSVMDDTGLRESFDRTDEITAGWKTADTQKAEREIAAAGDGSDSEILGAWDTLKAMARNPLASAEMAIEQAGMILPTAAASRIAALPVYREVLESTLKRETKDLIARGIPKEIAEQAATNTAIRTARNASIAAGARAGMWTEAAMGAAFAGDQAAQTIITMDDETIGRSARYQALRGEGLDDKSARLQLAQEAKLIAAPLAAGSAAVIGRLSGALGREAEIFSGLGETTKGVIGAVMRFGGTVGREAVQEGAQEASEQVAANVGSAAASDQPVGIESATQGVGPAAAAGAVLGGVMGAGIAAGDAAAAATRSAPEQPTASQFAGSDSTATRPRLEDVAEANDAKGPTPGKEAATDAAALDRTADITSAFQRLDESNDEQHVETTTSGAGSRSPDDAAGAGVGSARGQGAEAQQEAASSAEASPQGLGSAPAVRGAPSEPLLPLDEKAHAAATSPLNDHPEPSDAQKEAGNYRKGHLRLHGLDLSIENPKGSKRSGVAKDGAQWTVEMRDHYGYIRGTKGRDKEHIDVYLGPKPLARVAYVVDQVEPESGKFDEHKVMLGYGSENEAKQAYLRNYSTGWRGMGNITAVPVDELKAWLQTPQVKPFAKAPRMRAMDDARLADPTLRQQLEAMGPQGGWSEVGGRVLRAEDTAGEFNNFGYASGANTTGEIVGRTPWVPAAPWFPEAQRVGPLPDNEGGKATAAAVRKAIEGRPMSAAEKRHVGAMLDWADAEARDYEAQGAAGIDPFALAGVIADEGGDPAVSLVDEALVAKAIEKDEAAVERAAAQHDDDADFMAAIRSIIDGSREVQGQAADRATGPSGQELQGADAGGTGAGQFGVGREAGGSAGREAEDEVGAAASQASSESGPEFDAAAEAKRGRDAIEKVIAEKADVPDAMSRPGLGSVSFYWGKPGDPKKDFAGGFGVAKIIAKRDRERLDGRKIARRMPDVIATGAIGEKYGPKGGERINVTKDGTTAVLSLHRFGEQETWLLTGWEAEGSGAGVNPAPAYAPEPSGMQEQVGAKSEGTATARSSQAVDDGSRFAARDRSPSGALSNDELRAVAAGINAGMELKIVPFSKLPATIQDEARKQGYREGEIQGVFHDGKIYLVEGGLRSAAEVEEAVFHEMTHAGLRAMYGRGMVRSMNSLYEAIGGVKGYLKYAQRYGISEQMQAVSRAYLQRKDLTREQQTALIFEELLAHAGGRIGDPGIVQRVREIVGRFRAWLRSRGLAKLARYGDSDLAAVIRRARLAAQQRSSGRGDRPAFMIRPTEPIYFSQMQEVIRDQLPRKGGASIFRGMIESWQRSGKFRKEELEWSGLLEWLQTQGPNLTKGEVLNYLDANQIRIEESVRSGAGGDDSQELLLDAQDVLASAGLEAVQQDGQWVLLDDGGEQIDAAEADAETRTAFEIVSRASAGIESVGSTMYGQYQLPGGDNYRELLLTLPADEGFPGYLTQYRKRYPNSAATDNEVREYFERGVAIPPAGKTDIRPRAGVFRSAHFHGHPNILAHVRFNERTDPEGRRVLFVEEVQSDWHQKGRREGYAPKERPPPTGEVRFEPEVDSNYPYGIYVNGVERNRAKTGRSGQDDAASRAIAEDILSEEIERVHGRAGGGVPDAPFKQSWPLLAMKRVLRWAAENGFDSVAWTTGEQQAARYDLRKQVKEVNVFRHEDGEHYDVSVKSIADRRSDLATRITESKLAETIGKDLADKAIAQEPKSWSTYRDLDLTIGGDGMRAFYDRELVSEVNRYVKKWGGKVGETEIPTDALAPRFADVMLDRERREDNDEAEFATVHSLEITPEMRAAVLQPQPMFMARPPRSRQEMMEDEAWRKAGLPRENVPLPARLERWATQRWAQVKEDFLDNFQTGMFDRFKPIRDAEGNVDTSRSGYVSARLSTGGSSVLYGSMLYGAPEMRDGLIQKREGSRGLLQILEPVAGDLNRWAAWMVGKRADMLADQHRENNLTLEEIAYLKSLAGDQEATYEAVAKEVRGFMTDVLRMMKSAGLLTTEQVEEFSKDAYYLPFYRVEDEPIGGDRRFEPQSVVRPFVKRGLSHQSSGIKRLKGGKLALTDPIENLFAHLSRSIDASMKNYALARVVANTAGTGLISTAKEGDREKAIRVMWEGKPRWFNVDDPALLRAITAVGERPRAGFALDAGRTMRMLLTTGITMDPAFMLRNFMRDSMHSWLIDKNGFKFGVDSLRGAKATLQSIRKQAAGKPESADPVVVSMMFAGASFVGGHVYGTDPAANAAAMRKALRRKGLSAADVNSYMDSMVTTPARMLSMYNEIGEAIENANRIAVVKAALQKGVPLTQALYEGKDLMDFSLRGQWALVQVLADVVPFFNARLQGLYKLGREARRDPKLAGIMATQIAARGALVALASIALVAAYAGDDRYEELEEWDKDANWHFWVNGVHYRVPKPFELGILFATIPERMYRLATGYDKFGETAQSATHGMLTTLQFNPIPQAVRPIAELYFNYDMFRQRQIETLSDRRKLPEERFSSHTSPTMVELGQLTGVSPKKLQYLWNGYLGTLGSYALMIPDMLVRAARGDVMPAKRIEDYPIIGSFARTGPAWNTEFMTELYELAEEAEQTERAVRDRYDRGDEDGGTELAAERAELLAAREMLSAAADNIGDLRKQRDAIVNDPGMDPKTKRAEVDAVQREINRTAREAVEGAAEFGVQ